MSTTMSTKQSSDCLQKAFADLEEVLNRPARSVQYCLELETVIKAIEVLGIDATESRQTLQHLQQSRCASTDVTFDEFVDYVALHGLPKLIPKDKQKPEDEQDSSYQVLIALGKYWDTKKQWLRANRGKESSRKNQLLSIKEVKDWYDGTDVTFDEFAAYVAKNGLPKLIRKDKQIPEDEQDSSYQALVELGKYWDTKKQWLRAHRDKDSNHKNQLLSNHVVKEWFDNPKNCPSRSRGQKKSGNSCTH